MTDSMPSFLGLLQAERGSPSPFFTGPKAKDYIENMPNFGNIYSPPEKEKSFLDKFIDKEYFQESLQEQLKENFKSYRPKDKSSQEKVFDFLSKSYGNVELFLPKYFISCWFKSGPLSTYKLIS